MADNEKQGKQKQDEEKTKEGRSGLVKVNLSQALKEAGQGKEDKQNGGAAQASSGDDVADTKAESGKNRGCKAGRRPGRLRKALYITTAAALFIAGGKYYGAVSEYTIGTANEIKTSLSLKYNSIRNRSEKSIQRIGNAFGSDEKDVLEEAIRIINEGKTEQETLKNIADTANSYRSAEDLNREAVALTYTLIQDGKLNREGLLELKKEINGKLGLSGTIEYIINEPEQSRVKIAKEVYKTLNTDDQSKLAVYFVSVIDDEKRDITVAAIVPQLSPEGRKKVAKNIAREVVKELDGKIEEICGNSAICRGFLENYTKAHDFEKKLVDNITGMIQEGIGNFRKYMEY